MSVLRMRLLLLAVAVTIAGIAVVARSGTPVPSQAEQDRIDAREADARLAGLPSPAPSIPVRRASLIACLRAHGFAVHAQAPQTLVVSGRGLAGTPLRIIDGVGDPGANPELPPGWGAVNNVAFGSLGAWTAEATEMRRAFFGCVAPRASG